MTLLTTLLEQATGLESATNVLMGTGGYKGLLTINDNTAQKAIEALEREGSVQAHTGLIQGGSLTINTDTTKFDVSAGSAMIVDRSNPINPVVTRFSWSAKPGEGAVYLTTSTTTFIGINSGGNIVQQTSDFSPSQLRTVVRLGKLNHFNKTIINDALNLPVYYNTDLDLLALVAQFGSINITGNQFSANGANLKLNKSQGVSFRTGANSNTDKNNPNMPTIPSASQISFVPAYRNGSGGTTLQTSTTDINTTLWDNGSGTLQAIPSNNYVILTALFFPYNNTQTLYMLYSQAVYANFDTALSFVASYSPIINNDLSGGNIRAFIIVKKDTTNLAAAIAANTARIIDGVIFDAKGSIGGTAGGGAIPTLQSAYNVSTTQPQIVINDTNKAIQIKSARSTSSAPITTWLNSSSAVVGTIDGAGKLDVDNLIINKASVIDPSPIITFDTTSTDGYMGIYQTASSLQIGLGTTIGNPYIDIRSAGILKPKNPTFFAQNSSNRTYATGDGTAYTVPFDLEMVDYTNNFNTATYTFTAPITGSYYFSAAVEVSNFSVGTLVMMLRTTSKDYHLVRIDADASASTSFLRLGDSLITQLTSGDTAYILLICYYGTKVVTVVGNSSEAVTYFCGTLIG